MAILPATCLQLCPPVAHDCQQCRHSQETLWTFLTLIYKFHKGPTILNKEVNNVWTHFRGTCIYGIPSSEQNAYKALRAISHMSMLSNLVIIFSLLQNMADTPNVQPIYKFHQTLPNSLYLPVYLAL